MDKSGNSNWCETEAKLSGVRKFDATRNSPSGWELTYAYEVDGQQLAGNFYDYAGSEVRSYNIGDTLRIRYKASNPAKSKPLGSQSFLQWAWPIWLAVAVGAAVVFTVLFLRHR